MTSAGTCSHHIQTLPLRFFDTQRHGDIMSYFTNDVDTVSDALNNSFAMFIQSFIQVVGTLVMLFVLNWQLSLIVVLGYAGHVPLYPRTAAKRSNAYYTAAAGQPGRCWTATSRRWSPVRRWSRCSTTRRKTCAVFNEKNEALRKAGTGAQSYAATMVPAVVSISYINYAVVAVLGGIMAIKRPDRCRQPGQLSGVCPPGGHAHQPVHPAEQLPAGGPGRRGAHLRGHGASRPRWTRARSGWSMCGRKGNPGRLRGKDRPLGLAEAGRAHWSPCGATCASMT